MMQKMPRFQLHQAGSHNSFLAMLKRFQNLISRIFQIRNNRYCGTDIVQGPLADNIAPLVTFIFLSHVTQSQESQYGSRTGE
jgi:hypothetical protein